MHVVVRGDCGSLRWYVAAEQLQRLGRLPAGFPGTGVDRGGSQAVGMNKRKIALGKRLVKSSRDHSSYAGSWPSVVKAAEFI